MQFINHSQSAATNYAALKNARFSFSASQIKTIQQRWNETYNSLPKFQQRAVDASLQGAINEFRRRNPNITSTKKLKKLLAKSYYVPMVNIGIDDTMQRQLNIAWVCTLLHEFVATKVIPIQVYQPDPDKEFYLAWDGQHTLVLLWLICTQIFGENPQDWEIPVNVYSSHQKAEMRTSFIDLNSEAGKKMLDLFDKMEQMIYGVRVDKATFPLWQKVEQKQTIIENHGLFLTSKKFGDDDQPGAISRMQEIYKLELEPLEYLCKYLVYVGAQNRPTEEKEMVMMSYFFEKCRLASLKLTDSQISKMAQVAIQFWRADFSPGSNFWGKASTAYYRWHQNYIGGLPRFSKEPLHGFPFLAETFKKYVPGLSQLSSHTNSNFMPDKKDLF